LSKDHKGWVAETSMAMQTQTETLVSSRLTVTERHLGILSQRGH